MLAGSIVTRCEAKQWLPMNFVAERFHFRRFDEVRFTYANLIDYSRILLGFWLFAVIANEQHLLAAVMIIANYLLDWIDGPVARNFHQCTQIGATLDWYADFLTNIAQVVWWDRIHPQSALWFGWPFICAEMAVMLLDSIYYIQGRYPILRGGAESQQQGTNLRIDKDKVTVPRLLSLSLCEGSHGSTYRYTNFYSVIWFAFPVCASTLCCQLGYGYALMPISHLVRLPVHDVVTGATQGWLWLNWTVGLFLSVVFIVTEMQMAWFLLKAWFERRERPKGLVASFDDTMRSSFGGCAVFPSLTSYCSLAYSSESKFVVSHCLPKIVPYAPISAVAFECSSIEALLEALQAKPYARDPQWLQIQSHCIVIPRDHSADVSQLPIEHLHVPLDAQIVVCHDPDKATSFGAVCSPVFLCPVNEATAVHYLPQTLLRKRRDACGPLGRRYLVITFNLEC